MESPEQSHRKTYEAVLEIVALVFFLGVFAGAGVGAMYADDYNAAYSCYSAAGVGWAIWCVLWKQISNLPTIKARLLWIVPLNIFGIILFYLAVHRTTDRALAKSDQEIRVELELNEANRRSRQAPPRPYDFSDLARRKEFIEWLRHPQKTPRSKLRIGCLAGSDVACTAAGQFLLLASEAGWKIAGDRVFLMSSQIPTPGVALASRPDPGSAKLPKLPPHLGRWHKMTPSEVTLWAAFGHMHILIGAATDSGLTRNTNGIYFGTEPKPY